MQQLKTFLCTYSIEQSNTQGEIFEIHADCNSNTHQRATFTYNDNWLSQNYFWLQNFLAPKIGWCKQNDKYQLC